MQECCPNCGLKFEREQGYFLGAMYISYGLALITIVGLGLLLWALTSWSLQKITLWAILLFSATGAHADAVLARALDLFGSGD